MGDTIPRSNSFNCTPTCIEIIPIQFQKHSLFNHTSIVLFFKIKANKCLQNYYFKFFSPKVLEFYLFIYGTDYRGLVDAMVQYTNNRTVWRILVCKERPSVRSAIYCKIKGVTSFPVICFSDATLRAFCMADSIVMSIQIKAMNTHLIMIVFEKNKIVLNFLSFFLWSFEVVQVMMVTWRTWINQFLPVLHGSWVSVS